MQGATFAHVRQALAAGQTLTEMSIQGFMLEQFARHGLDIDSPPIVGINAHAADPHFYTRPETDTPLRPGDFLLLDLWGREPRPDAIYADITWVACAAAQAPARVQAVFDLVRQARDTAVAFAAWPPAEWPAGFRV